MYHKTDEIKAFAKAGNFMKNTMILISGMPATGKTTLAVWLSQKLRAPLVSYDRILEKLTRIKEKSAGSRKDHPDFSMIPYEFFLFEMEEIMRSSALFIAEYIFSSKMVNLLDPLSEKYGYQTINIHMNAAPKTAYRRFTERNDQDAESKKIRPAVSLEDFFEATKQNRDFLFGTHLIEVDAEDFSAISYERIYEAVKKWMQESDSRI